ncbi:MAG: hypothetical protein NTW87_30790, partial [Planctomycetota bacterium]|nr:hypothetical protein [Planctomycetota bacterium]
MALWLAVLALLAGFLSSRVWGEEDPARAKAKELDDRLKADRARAELLSDAQRALTPEQKKALRDKMTQTNTALEKKQNDANYKQIVLDNLGAVKEQFAKAEDSWKNQKFGEAGALYSSVSGATVPGSEEMVETSRGRLVEMEDLAKTHLKAAEDCDFKREYVKEVEELSLVNKEFALTKTREVALRRLITLKSKPEVAGYVEMAQAEGLETDGKLMEAIGIYHAVAN